MYKKKKCLKVFLNTFQMYHVSTDVLIFVLNAFFLRIQIRILKTIK